MMNSHVCIECKKICLETVEAKDSGFYCYPCSENLHKCESCKERVESLILTNRGDEYCSECFDATHAEDRSIKAIDSDAWKGEPVGYNS